MKKYITILGHLDIIYMLDRSQIVGTEGCGEACCYVLISSGARVFINGLWAEQVIEELNKFDLENSKDKP